MNTKIANAAPLTDAQAIIIAGYTGNHDALSAILFLLLSEETARRARERHDATGADAPAASIYELFEDDYRLLMKTTKLPTIQIIDVGPVIRIIDVGPVHAKACIEQEDRLAGSPGWHFADEPTAENQIESTPLMEATQNLIDLEKMSRKLTGDINDFNYAEGFAKARQMLDNVNHLVVVMAQLANKQHEDAVTYAAARAEPGAVASV